MADRLEALFNRFSVQASLFHVGKMCGTTEFPRTNDAGQLHLLKGGRLLVYNNGADCITVSEPSLLLYPQPMQRRFVADTECGAELICADLHFGGGTGNPIAAALPPFLCISLSSLEGTEHILTQLFEEAFNQRCGRQALINRLFEIVLIQVLRYAMETKQITNGMLAGMSHEKLRKSLIAMHDQPSVSWTLESLAKISGMSRSVFASQFREAVGCTVGAYLQAWRICLAQQALRNGQSIKMIINEVGYGSEAAFSRAFKKNTGVTPADWRREHEAR